MHYIYSGYRYVPSFETLGYLLWHPPVAYSLDCCGAGGSTVLSNVFNIWRPYLQYFIYH